MTQTTALAGRQRPTPSPRRSTNPTTRSVTTTLCQPSQSRRLALFNPVFKPVFNPAYTPRRVCNRCRTTP
jgi:hypothetical protein